MSRKVPIAIAALCLILPLELVAAQAAPRTVPKQPAPTEAQLLAGLTAELRLTDAQLMQTYREHPGEETARAFLAAVHNTFARMDKAGWRIEWGQDPNCPGGSMHCPNCGCAFAVPKQGSGCRSSLPDSTAKISPSDAEALLHQTFVTLETEILQRFVHGPRLIVVQSLIVELKTTLKETNDRIKKQTH